MGGLGMAELATNAAEKSKFRNALLACRVCLGIALRVLGNWLGLIRSIHPRGFPFRGPDAASNLSLGFLNSAIRSAVRNGRSGRQEPTSLESFASICIYAAALDNASNG